jgi:hypothetical protein
MCKPYLGNIIVSGAKSGRGGAAGGGFGGESAPGVTCGNQNV